jgi:hypothetical protein
MPKTPRPRTCAICRKPIPPGVGVLRRWPEFIHVECGHNEAKKTKKHP